jgi:ubiquitin C-terminal hydrolase
MNKQLKDIDFGVSKFHNNSGVICYMNSILAILQQTPILCDYILTGQFKDKIKSTESILFQLYNILNLSHTHDSCCINPENFRKIISLKNDMWAQSQHQDSQEFLSFLLNSVEEELSDKVHFIPGRILQNSNNLQQNLLNLMANNAWHRFIKNEFSIIKNLFGGLNHVNIVCSYCNNKSHNFDFFQILQLSCNNNSTLEECLDEFNTEETVDNDNMIKCDFCGHYNKSTKQTFLWKLPKILIIQLKRFEIKNYRRIKISKMVEYPINLNMNKYIDNNIINKDDYNYSLFAVNNHHSIGNYNSINFGHYTSNVINRFDNKWYTFDDSKKIIEVDDIVSENAYMLFYIKN